MMTVIERVKNAFRKQGREERKRFGALDKNGSEVLDSTPMQPPIGYNPQPSMFDVMRKMMEDHRKDLEAAGLETPEEADDFDVPDDDDPVDRGTPYEHDFDPPASPDRVPSQVPPPSSGKAQEPPSDGPATPPAGATGDGSPAPAQGGPAKV